MTCPACASETPAGKCAACSREIFFVAFRDPEDYAFISQLALRDERTIEDELVHLVKWVRENYTLPEPERVWHAEQN